MAAYVTKHVLAAAANKPHTMLAGSASIIVQIHDIFISSRDAPADNQYEYDILRITGVGTGGTAITPEPVTGYGATPSATIKGGTFTTDPTIAGTGLQPLIFNHRASLRVPMVPGYELRSKPAASNGLVLQCITAGGSANIVASTGYSE